MRNGENIEKKLNVIPMSKEAEKRLYKVAAEIKGKNLFSEKTEQAIKTLQDVKLPM